VIAAASRRELTAPLLIGALALLVAVIYSDSFLSMVEAWSYSSYRHGFVVLPISAYLLWRLRGPLTVVELRPWPWGIAPLVAVVALWFVARAVGVQVVEQLAAVLLIPATIATCLGPGVVRRALFPLLFLVVAVPFGDELVPHLMRVTADVASFLLRAFGVPVFREGQFISLPGGDFEIADVCSGLRSLVAGETVALVYAYLTYESNLRRSLFVAGVGLCLVVVNGIRAFTVMWVASSTGMRLLGGDDHIYFGWVLFALVMGGLFWLGARYSDRRDGNAVVAAAEPAAGGARTWPMVLVFGLLMLAITAKPMQQDSSYVSLLLLPVGALFLWAVSRLLLPAAAGGQSERRISGYRQLGGAAVSGLAVILLGAGPVLWQALTVPAGAAERDFRLPRAAGCAAPGAWTGGWRPELQQADFAAAGSYLCGDHPVNAVVAGYFSNVQGRELVNDENQPVPHEWRRFVTAGNSRFDAGDGRRVEVNEVVHEGGGFSSLIWYWYVVGDRTATRPAMVKMLQAIDLVEGRGQAGALFWLETPLGNEPSAARNRLARVAGALAAADGSR
jgi:exosortase A